MTDKPITAEDIENAIEKAYASADEQLREGFHDPFPTKCEAPYCYGYTARANEKKCAMQGMNLAFLQLRKYLREMIALRAQEAEQEPVGLYFPGMKGCSDGNCLFEYHPPGAMITNGGCRCEKELMREPCGLKAIRTIRWLRANTHPQPRRVCRWQPVTDDGTCKISCQHQYVDFPCENESPLFCPYCQGEIEWVEGEQ